MGEQSLDLRATFAILRRRRRDLIPAAILGAATGIVFALLQPAMYSSSSIVLLPPAQTSSDQAPTRDKDTEIRIATSDAVLGPAGAAVVPAMSVSDVAKHVEVSAPTNDLIQIKATARTADLARSLAQAVAEAEVGFIARGPSSLKNAERASLDKRRKDLQDSLDTVSKEIQKTTARRAAESPDSAEGRSDATALSQLTAQQASLVLQMDQLKGEASLASPGGAASVIQEASPAQPPDLLARLAGAALLCAATAVAIAALVVVVVARRDRKLHYRDDFADAVGSPVIASIGSRVPQNTAGWAALLESYTPGNVDAWALRQALRQLVFGESALRQRRRDGGDGVRHPASVTVITISDDLRALALGPQLASYAASVGVRTRLLAAQGHEAAAALWAACCREPADEEIRPDLLVRTGPRAEHGVDGPPEEHELDSPGEERPVEAEPEADPEADSTDDPADDPADDPDVDLTVVLAVVDRREPKLLELPETSVTVLAVSPGSVTAEDVARTAVAADDAGQRIAGIIVADPDHLDRTTGRLLQHERNQQVPLPIRLTGMTGPKAGGSNVSGLARRPR